MKRYVCLATSLLLLSGAAGRGHCAAVGSVLKLVSPPAVAVHSAEQPLIAVNSSGQVVIAYKGREGEAKMQPFAACGKGGTWQSNPLPIPPEVKSYYDLFSLRSLLAVNPGFEMLAIHYGKAYLFSRKGGQWAAPQLIIPDNANSTVTGLGERGGRLVLVEGTTGLRYHHRKDGQWHEIKLPFTVSQRRMEPLFTDLSGALLLVALRGKAPLVAGLGKASDPAQAGSWVLQPPDGSSCTAPFSTATYDLDLGLDWPHQRIYATWRVGDSVYVGWAPVGATQSSQWGQAKLEVPEKTSRTRACLRSNGRGGVGLLVHHLTSGDPHLRFHWLSGSGLGPAIPLLRPGTETEASVFSGIDSEGFNFCIDDGGTAHLAVIATKRGEVPAGTRRIYYATVTGGGTATAGPDIAGGTGTTEMEREGPAPDFVVKIIDPEPGESMRGGSGQTLFSNALKPKIQVTNQGAQYFGDLAVEANIDGAVVKVRIPDESDHRMPLLKRGESKTLYLPPVAYHCKYQGNATPPVISYDQFYKNHRIELNTGLGRKKMTVRVDPESRIPEADEENNSAEVEYIVYDGYSMSDREKVGTKMHYGLNDLALLQPPVLRSNTRILSAGYVQRPTVCDVLVGNPRLAGFFLNAELVATLDGRELTRQNLGIMTRDPNLYSGYTGQTIVYQKGVPKPDLSAEVVRLPIDLTQVSEGDHVLRVVVDPQDKFADRKRDNNAVELRFRVRSPGGTLRVRVVDYNQPHPPVARATIVLQDLFADFADQQGVLEIADVPRGSYNNKALYADREDPEPRYFNGYAPAFTVADKQVVDLTIQCERALNITGEVRVAGTGALLTDEYIEAFICDPNGIFAQGSSNGSRYRIENVPPGQHTIVCGAYGFVTKETVAQIRRTSTTTDDCTVNLQLVDGPRATVTGKVQDLGSNKPLADATVWLQGAPRAVATSADGSFRLDRVAAGRDYGVWAQAGSHTTEGTTTGVLAAGQTKDVGVIELGAITAKFTSIDFNATTWAICEETAKAGEIPSFRVSTEFGAFTGALGLMYHATAGKPTITIDNLIIWLQGENFIQGGVSANIGVETFTGVSMDTLKVGIMKDVLSGVGHGFKVLDGVNKLAAWLQGPVDPSMMHRNNEVVGTYTSHTGTAYKEDPLIDIPLSTDVPVAMTFSGGGETKVRVDILEIEDAQKRKKTVHPEWYSPGFAVYRINQEFDSNTPEVKLFVSVLNSRLQSGVLGNCSQNLIHWKPMQDRWLRISGYKYR